MRAKKGGTLAPFRCTREIFFTFVRLWKARSTANSTRVHWSSFDFFVIFKFCSFTSFSLLHLTFNLVPQRISSLKCLLPSITLRLLHRLLLQARRLKRPLSASRLIHNINNNTNLDYSAVKGDRRFVERTTNMFSSSCSELSFCPDSE